MATRRKVLILGCGYLGGRLAAELLRDGDEVMGWVRSAESEAVLAKEGVIPWSGDLAEATAWEGLPRDFDGVVHCASSGRGGVEAYRSIYLAGVRQAVRQLPKTRLLFVSSTSVYGQEDGAVVTEESPAEPTTETGKVLREAEQVVLTEGADGSAVFRVAGIYGPGRGVLLRKFLAGEAVIEGDGMRWINQVHRDDVAGALRRALDPHQPLSGGIYNVADDEPVNYLTYYGWLAERTGKAMPPFGPVNRERKRGWTHKRVSNAKLRAAGWAPRFPTFREGLASELQQ